MVDQMILRIGRRGEAAERLSEASWRYGEGTEVDVSNDGGECCGRRRHARRGRRTTPPKVAAGREDGRGGRARWEGMTRTSITRIGPIWINSTAAGPGRGFSGISYAEHRPCWIGCADRAQAEPVQVANLYLRHEALRSAPQLPASFGCRARVSHEVPPAPVIHSVITRFSSKLTAMGHDSSKSPPMDTRPVKARRLPAERLDCVRCRHDR
jgi:hypothetical protein